MPRIRRFQFRLRTLMIAVAICATVLSLLVALHRKHTLSRRRFWWNSLDFADPGDPRFAAGAFAVGGKAPTVAFFVRVDDPTIAIQAPPSWWKEDGEGYILVENRRVPHLSGRLQLFVAVDGRKPTCLILEREDARKYFGIDNTEFVKPEAFVGFWNDVLEKKYLSRDTR